MPKEKLEHTLLRGAPDILLWLKNNNMEASNAYLLTSNEAVWLSFAMALNEIESKMAKHTLQEAYLFTPEKQAHIFRPEGEYFASIHEMNTNDSQEMEYHPTTMVLWGSYKGEENGYCCFREDRGTETRLEKRMEGLDGKVFKKGDRIGLLQHNYLDFDPECLKAGYIFTRFIGFKKI